MTYNTTHSTIYTLLCNTAHAIQTVPFNKKYRTDTAVQTTQNALLTIQNTIPTISYNTHKTYHSMQYHTYHKIRTMQYNSAIHTMHYIQYTMYILCYTPYRKQNTYSSKDNTTRCDTDNTVNTIPCHTRYNTHNAIRSTPYRTQEKTVNLTLHYTVCSIQHTQCMQDNKYHTTQCNRKYNRIHTMQARMQRVLCKIQYPTLPHHTTPTCDGCPLPVWPNSTSVQADAQQVILTKVTPVVWGDQSELSN